MHRDQGRQPILLAAISHRGNHIAICEGDGKVGQISIFNSKKWKIVDKYDLEENKLYDLVMIKFTPNENQVMLGYGNGYFLILNAKSTRRKLSVAQKETRVHYVTIDPAQENVYSCGINNIYLTPIPKRIKKNLDFEEQIVNVREKDGNFFLLKPKRAKLSEITLNDLQETEISLPQEIDIICIEWWAVLEQYIVACKQEGGYTISTFDSVSLDFEQKIINESQNDLAHFSMIATRDGRLIIYDVETIKIYTERFTLRIEKKLYSTMTTMHYIETDWLIFDQDHQEIRFWEFNIDRIKSIKHRHRGPVTSFAATPGPKYLFSGHYSGTVFMWKVSKKKLVATLDCHTTSVTSLRIMNDYLYSYSSDSRLCLWRIKTKVLAAQTLGRGLQNLTITNNTLFFIHSGVSKIEINKNLMLSEEISVIGVQDPIRFMKYIKKLYNLEEPFEFDKRYETGVIFPYVLTPMHFFAYLNRTEHLKKSLESGSTLSNSSFNENPLSLAAKQQFIDCTEIIIHHLVKHYNLVKNPYLLRVLNNKSIITLNNIQNKRLAKLYELFMRKASNSKLPQLINNRIKTPIYRFSDEVEPTAKEFQIESDFTDEAREVQFLESLLKLNLRIGSKDSQKFLNSLINTPNQEIFFSNYVKIILQSKWKALRVYMIAQAMIYLVFLLFMIGFLVWFIDDPPISREWFLVMPFCLNLFLLAIEFLQMYASPKSYFIEIKNGLDLLRSGSSIIYFTLVWSGVNIQDTRIFLIAIIALSLVRGVIYFRMYQPTRYLIHLIQSVINDGIAFLIIFIYTTLSTGFLLFSLGNDRDLNVADAIWESYTLNLGDFSTDEYDNLERIVFVAATFVNSIIMLNLLISIFNDTYARVKQNIAIAQGIELASMIVELESLFFWNRELKKPQYIHACSDRVADKAKDPYKKLRWGIKKQIDQKFRLLETIRQEQNCQKQEIARQRQEMVAQRELLERIYGDVGDLKRLLQGNKQSIRFLK